VLAIDPASSEYADPTDDARLAAALVGSWVAVTLAFAGFKLREWYVNAGSSRLMRVSEEPSADVIWHGKEF